MARKHNNERLQKIVNEWKQITAINESKNEEKKAGSGRR